LFGDYNPAGRLTQTWPQSIDQIPSILDYDILHGATYLYFKHASLYPFGYGLSYTSFAYSHLKIDPIVISSGAQASVSVAVKNTGSRTGDEVLQMYVRYHKSRVERPLEELAGFRRITLQPGQTKTVALPLKAEALEYWDDVNKKFVLEEGKIDVRIGSSSADIRLEKSINVSQ
jgi:beta-glucosidase